MKPIKLFLVLALVLVPTLASAQGYGPGPGYGRHGFHHRMNRLAWGFSIGIGGMGDHGSGITNCTGCDASPAALEIDAHLGGMLTDRFAILLELQSNAQTVSATGRDSTYLEQDLAMIAAQYWLLPQVWVKGGVGVAHLGFDSAYSDGGAPVANGGALMAAIGFEIFSGRLFAMDLQARIVEGTYKADLGDSITAANIGLGFNWY
jgi:hypothetical protein